MTPSEAHDWLQVASPGDRVEYWRGAFLGYEVNYKLTDNRNVCAICTAKVFREADKAGLCFAVHKKNGEGDYSYLAIKRSPARGRSVPGANRALPETAGAVSKGAVPVIVGSSGQRPPMGDGRVSANQ